MPSIKTVALSALFILLAGNVIADPASTAPGKPDAVGAACPTGKDNLNHPGIPIQCTECAAPGCPSCHSERTRATVAAANTAVRDCPKLVQPH